MHPNASIDYIVDQIVKEVCKGFGSSVVDASQVNRPPDAAVSRPYWNSGSVTSDARLRLEYTNLRPSTTVEQLRKLCDKAKMEGADAVCVLPWLVELAKNQLKGTDIKVVTLIGLPGGEGRSQAKYAAVKQAVLAGADVVEVSIPMREFIALEEDAVCRHLKESTNFAKGRADTRALVDIDKVGSADAKRLADMVRQTNMCGVSFYGKSSDSKTDLLTELARNGVEVKLLSGRKDRVSGIGLAVLGIEI